ncbi:MAG: sensor histidine kinase [Bradyrhizobium sp.]|uniref:sensor histidine kinase n=1 Tax=Bradyrhizobium sp. TaxID=376 RepID=UPI001D1AFA97|nr:sensor histidine kinase [Bradyrhizobium sp.]MBV9562009.1 sensor histidine kinase [Bradyrhizobium sp.]
MWNLARSDLKYRLTLRVAAVSAFCFAVTSAYLLVDADRSAQAKLDDIAAITARTLEMRESKRQWLGAARADFPDLDSIAALVMTPGLCLTYRSNAGELVQRVCGGAPDGRLDAPAAFAAFYRAVFDPGREAVRPVLVRGTAAGAAVAWIDPAVLTADAWREASRLMAVLAVALLLLCALVYAALARALRPTRLVRAGLERIAAGDLSARLPAFDLAELSAIRDVFNQLAENLASALAERSELTRRLIALQDDERRRLARELHDEFGQSLAAIRALAASVRQSAATDCPAILPECDSIARTATGMMETLRGALFRLRPPDVDELGLAASLEGLVAGWNGRSRGAPRFDIHLAGDLESLPPAIGADLYRIAQEALTNAAKHAEATRVCLRLTRREDGGVVELSVDDDGRAGEQTVRSGMGLLGMRERVAALGGRLSFESREGHGSALQAVIPVHALPALPVEEPAATERAA